MSYTGGENIYSMRSKSLPAVVTMPARNQTRATARVITMPSQAEQQTKVITLPASAEGSVSGHRSRSEQNALSAGVRMTLVALFALLGWPHPTRDNDPGPSAARPCHWELTSLISRLRLPSAGNKAAAAAIRPCASEEISDEGLLRAA